QLHEVCRQTRQALEVTIGKAPLDEQILTFDVAKLPHSFQERSSILRGYGSRAPGQKTDAPHFALLLSEGRNRASRSAKCNNRNYGFTPFHSIPSGRYATGGVRLAFAF